MDELTLALGNPEQPVCCRGYMMVSWKYALWETSTAIKAAKEEESAKRSSGIK
jgi:hypothetical protein